MGDVGHNAPSVEVPSCSVNAALSSLVYIYFSSMNQPFFWGRYLGITHCFFLYFAAVKVMDTLISRHATRLLKLRVDEIEVKARIASGEDGKGQVRLSRSGTIWNDPTRHVSIKVQIYVYIFG